MSTDSRLTQTLQKAAGGSHEAVADLMPLVYSELRAIAGKQLQRERQNHTLQATALANEAYLRLVDQKEVDWKGRAHFLAVAAEVIRRILVDHARKKGAAKRGGGAAQVTLTLGEVLQAPGDQNEVDLRELAALRYLQSLNAVQITRANVCELLRRRDQHGLSPCGGTRQDYSSNDRQHRVSHGQAPYLRVHTVNRTGLIRVPVPSTL